MPCNLDCGTPTCVPVCARASGHHDLHQLSSSPSRIFFCIRFRCIASSRACKSSTLPQSHQLASSCHLVCQLCLCFHAAISCRSHRASLWDVSFSVGGRQCPRLRPRPRSRLRVQVRVELHPPLVLNRALARRSSVGALIDTFISSSRAFARCDHICACGLLFHMVERLYFPFAWRRHTTELDRDYLFIPQFLHPAKRDIVVREFELMQ
jgi:hypothetical protein